MDSRASGIRILVVDDEHLIVETLTEVLAWDGHEVETAASGVEALEKIAARTPELLLIDFMMPLMDGTAAIESLRARPETAELPIVLMTAAPQSVREQPLYDVLLLKPFKVTELRTAIQQALEARKR